MKQGFIIAPEDGTYKIKFEGDDFANLFKNYLRPRTKEILFGNRQFMKQEYYYFVSGLPNINIDDTKLPWPEEFLAEAKTQVSENDYHLSGDFTSADGFGQSPERR